jgi:hypothetical protein
VTADTTIKVAKGIRDKLARLAAERGTNIGGLVASFAEATPTAAEIAAEQERTRAILAEKFGVELGHDDLAEGQRLWAALDAGDDDALLLFGE